jgi:hypothetical protein
VVQLSDVVRGALLRGDVLDAHQLAEERHAAQGPLPAFCRSLDPELDVVAQLRRWLELAGLRCIRRAQERERRRAEIACRRLPCTRQEASGTEIKSQLLAEKKSLLARVRV